MNRRLAILAITLAVVIFLATGLALVRLVTWHDQGFQAAAPGAPSEPPRPSLAVVAVGSRESYPLAIGFAQALADRLYCAPGCLTQQFSDFETDDLLHAKGFRPTTDLVAGSRRLAECLGVDCAVAVELKTAGKSVALQAAIYRTREKGAPVTARIIGAKSDLAKIQTQLAARVADVLGLAPNPQQAADLKTPNFSNPLALELYGRSRLANSMAEAEGFLLKMLDSDRQSLFGCVRFVDFYARGPADCVDIDHAQAPGVLEKAEGRWPRNSLVRGLRSPLLTRLYRYSEAQDTASELVEADGDLALAHADLASVARRRSDAELAVKEAQWAVALWPSNPFHHAALARGCLLAAHNARRGHYYNEMSRETNRTWQGALRLCVAESKKAAALDPRCGDAWRTLIVAGRELGEADDTERAFRAACASDPDDLAPYVEYGFSRSPQWGGSRQEEMQVVDMAGRRFGQGSAQRRIVEAGVIRQYMYSTELTLGGRFEDDLRLPCSWKDRIKADLEQSLALVQCREHTVNRERPEIYETAMQGSGKWPSPTWRYLYGMGCQFRYEDRVDRAALNMAAGLFSSFAKEIPYEPRGWIEWGWCLSHQGNPREARKKFLKALELDPQDHVAREKLQYVQ